MAIRRWAVRPDQMLELGNGETIAVCSREAMREAHLDGETLQSISGGVVTSQVFRAPTDVEGEMVTIAAIFEWKDRSDAKAQPEVAAPTAPVPPDVILDPELAAAAEQAHAAAAAEPGAEPEEDLSSIPGHLQEVV